MKRITQRSRLEDYARTSILVGKQADQLFNELYDLIGWHIEMELYNTLEGANSKEKALNLMTKVRNSVIVLPTLKETKLAETKIFGYDWKIGE